MNQRLERVAGEVRAVLGEVLARDEIKDPRVRGIGLITVTHVRVSGDLRHAKAFFTVHGLEEPALERVRAALDHASGYFRHAISRRLRTKVSPAVNFEVDHVFEQAAHIESILQGLAPPTARADPDGGEEDGDKANGDKADGNE
ncbi:MAG TPA: 30S ribosome-binding factor RbfA [Polyangia bacterium]|nr:30S ribosome-binding factor RbfA [Polyangia bacterium]